MTASEDLTQREDVIVVGGGAAGLSAALVLGRARRRVTVVDAGAPRNAPAAHMQGFLSRDGMPPAQLLAIGRAEVTGYGVRVLSDAVVRVAPGFEVELASGTILRARRLLLTTGSWDELPAVDGLRERWGRDVLHCPYCHGYEVRDQALGVIGTIPESVQHALLVRQWSDDVTFLAHDHALTADERAALSARGIAIAEGVVERLLVHDDRLRGAELSGGGVVPLAALFVRPGNRPHPDGLAESLGCARDGAGFLLVDPSGATSVPGVWAAGNAVDPRAQVIMAAGAGSAAAMAINGDLVQDDLQRALAGRR
jgi:thioredoxin reductase